MFTSADRDRIHARVLEIARNDPRIVAGAIIGSFAKGTADEWSDLDLAFAAADGADPSAILDEWTAELERSESATQLFDLPAGSAVYRVLLFPGALQVDISVRPAADFLPKAGGFELVFGSAREIESPPKSPVGELFGWSVVYALHARACIARGRVWQAGLALDSVRHRLLAIECARRDLPTGHGRGFDQLPTDVLARYQATFAERIDEPPLRQALATLTGLLIEARLAVGMNDDQLGPELRELRAWASTTV